MRLELGSWKPALTHGRLLLRLSSTYVRYVQNWRRGETTEYANTEFEVRVQEKQYKVIVSDTTSSRRGGLGGQPENTSRSFFEKKTLVDFDRRAANLSNLLSHASRHDSFAKQAKKGTLSNQQSVPLVPLRPQSSPEVHCIRRGGKEFCRHVCLILQARNESQHSS